MKTADSKNTLRAALSALAIFAILSLYYHFESPGDIPWLRIGIVSAVLLCLNLLSDKMTAGTNRKLKETRAHDEMTPEQIEATLRFAWSKPLVVKYWSGLFAFVLIATLTIPSVWKGGFHPLRYILYALLFYAVVTLPFAIRIIYYRIRYGQWLFNYSAAKARELGHGR